jgi:single-strand DNA-binding protein
MYQKLIIIGHVGRDPEMRYTPSGSAVCNINVATNRKWTNSNGEQQEETVWFRVSCWNKSAENVAKYVYKGNRVLVEGRLTPDKETGGPRVWEDSNGNPRASYEMTAIDVRFLSKKEAAALAALDNDGEYEGSTPDLTEEEIPF